MTGRYFRMPRTIEELDFVTSWHPCRVCPAGRHFGAGPGSFDCAVCSPLPDGRPRRHYHARKHPRRRIRHYIEGHWS